MDTHVLNADKSDIKSINWYAISTSSAVGPYKLCSLVYKKKQIFVCLSNLEIEPGRHEKD